MYLTAFSKGLWGTKTPRNIISAIRLQRNVKNTCAPILSIFGWEIAPKDWWERFIHTSRMSLCKSKWTRLLSIFKAVSSMIFTPQFTPQTKSKTRKIIQLYTFYIQKRMWVVLPFSHHF